MYNKSKYRELELKIDELEGQLSAFRQLMENSTEGFFVIDLELNPIYLSPFTEQMLGYSSEEKNRINFENIYSAESLLKTKEVIEKALQEYNSSGANNVFTYEVEAIHKNGNIVYLENITKLLTDRSGKVFALQGSSRNITERKQLLETIRQKSAELEELNATKDKLFSIIAHDLRSPFSVILMYSGVLAKNILTRDINQSSDMAIQINAAAKSAHNLLENLLDWAKTQTKQVKYELTELDISELITSTINLSASESGVKGIALKYSNPESIKVAADSNMIKTVLRNLITNAIKYSNPGGEVVITSKKLQNEVIVEVADTGIGMSKDELGKLFISTVTESKWGTANEKGSGLGLVICKEFIEKHDGKISAESEPGQGSRFYFTIPLINSENYKSAESRND